MLIKKMEFKQYYVVYKSSSVDLYVNILFRSPLLTSSILRCKDRLGQTE